MLTVRVDLSAIIHNIRFIRSVTDTDFCAVVKSNAYGHGLCEVAKAVFDYVDCFAVATREEALNLVKSGIEKKILVFNYDFNGEKLPQNVIPSISSVEEAEALKGKAFEVSVAVNTGMNRFGVSACDFINVFSAAEKQGLHIHGAYTHFFNESDEISCKKQFEMFIDAVSPIKDSGIKLHCCASNCLVLPHEYFLDMVRSGLAMYGYGYKGVVPATEIYTDVIWTGKVSAGDHIGYGDFIAEKNMEIASLRVGYGDGFRRIKNHFVSVNGVRCPVLGNVCMDVCVIDVTGLDCKVGQRAYILGKNVDIDGICVTHSTISHEVLTMINERAERVYVCRQERIKD